MAIFLGIAIYWEIEHPREFTISLDRSEVASVELYHAPERKAIFTDTETLDKLVADVNGKRFSRAGWAGDAPGLGIEVTFFDASGVGIESYPFHSTSLSWKGYRYEPDGSPILFSHLSEELHHACGTN